MDIKPLVTIITPTYNHKAYIGQCIESVLCQTYDNWEQIIVDDCSPDPTVAIARRYEDSRIRIIQKPVRGGAEGLHVSYNTALGMARGSLIAVLEGDDYWPQDKLEIQVPFHQSRKIVMSWGANGVIQGTTVSGLEKRRSRIPKFFPTTSDLLIGNIIQALTVIADKESLLKIGGFWQPAGTVFVDHPTWLRLSRLGKILYIPQILGIYRSHSDQISKNQLEKMSSLNYEYPDQFMAELTPEERMALDMRLIAAVRDLRDAQRHQTNKEYLACLRLLAKAFWNGDFETRYLCLRNALHL